MFEVVVAADEYILDTSFMKKRTEFLLQNKEEYMIFSDIKDLSPKKDDGRSNGNFIFFWSGESTSIKKRIKECIDNGANVKVVNYGDMKLTAWITVKKNFPRNKYIPYEGKPFSCLKHLNNWVEKTEKMGGKVTYINYEIND